VNAFALQRIKEVLSTPKTRQELLEITKLPERTLRYNLAILKRESLLKESIIFSDLRKKAFSLDLKGGEKYD